MGLLVAACSGPTDAGPGPGPGPLPNAHAFASAGDRQAGRPRNPLPIPLEVTVQDDEGRPMAGVTVFWAGAHNGTVEALGPVTDANGRARARFTLGDTEGIASVFAGVVNVDSVPFTLSVRDEEDPPEPPPPPYGALLDQQFATFDGSGETVHPDFAVTPWPLPQQLAITPYPNGNAFRELPSLFSSRWGHEWELGPGVPNPVVPSPTSGHLSDPDIVWNPERQELWMYYRQATDRNLIWLVRSGDRGVTWTAPVLVVSTPNHEILSPSVVYRGPGDWWMWSVNGRGPGCSAADAGLEVRRSKDGITWSAPTALSLAHDGLFPWHVDVQWIPERQEYWALYDAKQPGSCTTPALFAATSPDGVTWTPTRRPLVSRGDHPAFKDIVYRATFRFDPARDDVWIWVSGAKFEGGRWTWSTLLTRRERADLLSALRVGAGPLTFRAPAAELVDWP